MWFVPTSIFNKNMKWITAEEARKVSDTVKITVSSKIVGEICSDISSKASLGYLNMTYPINNSKIDGQVLCEIVKKLKELGYKVEHNSGHDEREGDCWNNLYIAW